MSRSVRPAPLIRTFSYHYREKYGRVLGKIPLDTGVVCPNRQLGGCIYCRPAAFTPECLQSGDPLETQVERGKKHLLAGRFRAYLAYFQQETCTAMPAADLIALLQRVVQDEDCLGLILSTRPDHVSDEFLELLADLVEESGKECLLELGLQSMHHQSLKLLNRNHSLEEYTGTVERVLRMGNLEVGTHLMFGIPGETTSDMLETIRLVIACGVHALKLHHLQVVADTPLHAMYSQGKVSLFTLEGYLEFLLKILPEIPWSVTLHRLWTTTHPDLLIAPKWNILPAELSKQLHSAMEARGIRQGCNARIV